MYYIFVSSTKKDLKPILGVGKNEVKWCVPEGYDIKDEYHYTIKNNTRVVDFYSLKEGINENISIIDNELRCFHGYLLDTPSCFNKNEMDPGANYYGVYSHARITNENCWFATDEVGFSPLYYSIDNDVVFVSNNPNLIAIYKKRLGIKIEVEPSLAIYHIIGITNESNITGYKNIFRLQPWTYIYIDPQDNLSFPAKNRELCHEDYETLCFEAIKQLRKGIININEKFTHKYSELTGGYDSRLVLAFILELGVEGSFKFVTSGKNENPDYIVASLLANKYKLNHEITPRRNQEIEIDKKIWIKKYSACYLIMQWNPVCLDYKSLWELKMKKFA